MKAVVAAFNQEKALVGAFSVITNLRMELFQVLLVPGPGPDGAASGAKVGSSFININFVVVAGRGQSRHSGRGGGM